MSVESLQRRIVEAARHLSMLRLQQERLYHALYGIQTQIDECTCGIDGLTAELSKCVGENED